MTVQKKFGKLGAGPMSPEIVEALFSYSNKEGLPIMLVTSKNQVDWNGGYVSNWDTMEYVDFIKK